MSTILLKIMIILYLFSLQKQDISPTRVLSEFTVDNVIQPINKAVCKTKDNNYIIAWSYYQTTNLIGIKVTILYLSSLTNSNPITVKTGISQGDLSIACLINGGFAIAWVHSYSIYAAIYENDATIRKSVFFVASFSFNFMGTPRLSVSPLSNGDFLIVNNNLGVNTRYFSALGQIKYILNIQQFSNANGFLKSVGLSDGKSIVAWTSGSNLYYRTISNDGILSTMQSTVTSSLSNGSKFDVAELINIGFVITWECYSQTRICWIKYNYNGSIMSNRSIYYTDPKITMASPSIIGLQNGAYSVTFNFKFNNLNYVAAAIYDNLDNFINYDELGIDSVFKPILTPYINGGFGLIYESIDKKLKFQLYPYCMDFSIRISKPEFIDLRKAIFFGYIYQGQYRIVGLPSKGSLTLNNTPVSITEYYSLGSIMLFTPDSSDIIFKFSLKLSGITNYEMTCTATIYFICYSSCKSCVSTGSETNHNCSECKANYFPLIDKFSQCYFYSQIVPGYYFNNMYKLFHKCINNCKTCLDGSSCSECLNNYIYYQNQCVSSCPIALFIDTNTGKKQCVETCPNFFYLDILSKNCVSCPDKCYRCDDKGCMQCDTTSYLDFNTKKCLYICPDGFYQDSNMNTCVPCSSNCLKCTNSTYCDLCKINYFLTNNKLCVSSCPTLTYIDGNTCKPCLINCKECNDGNSCKTCITNFYLYLGGCYTICPNNYYADAYSNTCKQCNSYCETCTNSISCDKCKMGYYLDQFGNCVIDCGLSFYQDTQTRKCESCSSNCNECLNKMECSKCKANYLMQPDKTCLNSCQTGFYGNSQIGICEPCQTNCDICDNSIECINCSNGYLLDTAKNCVINCGQSYYANKFSGKCENCVLNCLLCQNNTQCTSCKDGYYLQPDKTCDIKCPPGYFINYDTFICDPCISNCLSCDDSLKCNTCNSGFYLNSSYLCTIDCGNEYYKDSITGKCQNCIPNCNECKNNSECTRCKTYFNLLPDKTCGSNCPLTYFPTSSFNCVKCIPKCDSCSDSLTCSKCSSGYYLTKSNTCVEDCSLGYYKDSTTGKCIECIPNCDRCDNNKQCIKCISSYYMLPTNSCTKICPIGFYQNNTTSMCISCIPNCLTCDDTANCTKCISGYFYDSYNKRCVSNCGLENFVDTLTGKCEKCPNNCQVCSNSVECIKCKANFFLQPDSSCQAKCPVRFYPNSSSGICQKCNDNCYECENSFNCISCIQNMFLLNLNDDFKKCQSSCPSEYFSNTDTRKCEKIILDMCSTTNPCKNEGVCSVNDNTVSCKCKEGYSGDYCEKLIPIPNSSDTNNSNKDEGNTENNNINPNNGGNNLNQNNDDNSDTYTDPNLPNETEKSLDYANSQINQMLSGNIPPNPNILDVSSIALSSTITTLLSNPNSSNSNKIDIDQFQKQVDEIKLSIGSLADVLLKSTDLTEPVTVSTELFTVQLQFTSISSNRRILTSTLKSGNSTIIESDECVRQIKIKNNIPSSMSLIMKQIDYSSSFNLTSITDTKRNSSNTFLIEFYHPLTRQKLDTSICNDKKIKIRSPNKRALYNQDFEKYKVLLSNGLDIYIPESEAFHSKCFILKDPDSEKDTTVNYRIENYFSNKTVRCSEGCEYEKIDDDGYVVCNCLRFPIGEVIGNTFYEYELSLIPNSFLDVISCGKVAFKSLPQNPAFYLSTIVLITSLILVFLNRKLELKLILNRLSDIIHFDCQFYKQEEISYEEYFNHNHFDNKDKSQNNYGSDITERNIDDSIIPPKNIKVNEYMTFNDKQHSPFPVGGVSGSDRNDPQNKEKENKEINDKNDNSRNLNQNQNRIILDNQHNDDNNSNIEIENYERSNRKRKKQNTRNKQEKSKKGMERSETKREDDNQELSVSVIPNNNQDKSYEIHNNSQIPIKNIQIKSNLSNRQPFVIKNYFEFKDNYSITNLKNVSKNVSINNPNSENKLEINSIMVSDQSSVTPKKPKNIFDIYPDHVPTFRDYYELSTKDAITCDKRGFKQLFLHNLVESHILFNLTYKVSIISPFWVRTLLLSLELELIFGLNAILFTDKYIDIRTNTYATKNILYSLFAEFPKIFFSITLTWIITKLCKLIATVPKYYREPLNYALRTRNNQIVAKSYSNLCQNMKLRHILLIFSVLTIHFCCWYYAIVFCGVYSGTAIGWIFGSIISLVLYWGVALIFICLWKAMIRINARKYQKLRYLEC